MSFFSNFQTDKCPGPINGNPMNGLAEKVCVQAQRVFDACIKQGQNEGLVLTLSDFTPANPTYPLTFISARSSSSQGTVTNLQVDRLPDKANCARVQAVVNIPMEVIYTDAAGVEGKAQAAIAVPQDVILFVPQPSIMPFGGAERRQRRRARGYVQFRGRNVYHRLLYYGHLKSDHQCRLAFAFVRLLRHSSRSGIYTGSVRRVLRVAALSAGNRFQ